MGDSHILVLLLSSSSSSRLIAVEVIDVVGLGFVPEGVYPSRTRVLRLLGGRVWFRGGRGAASRAGKVPSLIE